VFPIIRRSLLLLVPFLRQSSFATPPLFARISFIFVQVFIRNRDRHRTERNPNQKNPVQFGFWYETSSKERKEKLEFYGWKKTHIWLCLIVRHQQCYVRYFLARTVFEWVCTWIKSVDWVKAEKTIYFRCWSPYSQIWNKGSRVENLGHYRSILTYNNGMISHYIERLPIVAKQERRKTFDEFTLDFTWSIHVCFMADICWIGLNCQILSLLGVCQFKFNSSWELNRWIELVTSSISNELELFEQF